LESYTLFCFGCLLNALLISDLFIVISVTCSPITSLPSALADGLGSMFAIGFSQIVFRLKPFLLLSLSVETDVNRTLSLSLCSDAIPYCSELLQVCFAKEWQERKLDVIISVVIIDQINLSYKRNI